MGALVLERSWDGTSRRADNRRQRFHFGPLDSSDHSRSRTPLVRVGIDRVRRHDSGLLRARSLDYQEGHCVVFDVPVFRKIPDDRIPWGYRIHLENPPFPPAIDVSIELLESVELTWSPYLTWTPGLGLYVRTDNGYAMSWQELERDEARGVIRFGVP